MELQHSFSVPVDVDQAWAVLVDIEQVAPCMPGAALDTVDGDEFSGSVKVRLGPIGLTYKGKARFVEKDEIAHRAVIDAQGKDARGNGTASATVTATLHPQDDGTRVEVNTDLAITGKPAQFGRGVMADVGNKLIGQFADCLAGKLANADEPAAGPAAATVDSAPQPAAGQAANATTAPEAPEAPADEVAPIDLMASAGPAVLKRLAPVALLLAGLALLIILRRRRG
ncbi:MAG TPA: SRPBCC family protein [Jatrophihabitantaceae bacterium]|nr:SRPBCC family protein [Jatrophihabitantaceae bacterium]